jgi:hypothetical protein
MRFMFMVKTQEPASPTPELVQAMGKLIDREIKAGRLVDTGALMPIPTGAEVRLEGGEIRLIDGPFIEAKEVIGGYAIFDLTDKAEAIGVANEFMNLHRDHIPGWQGLCEVRPIASAC